MAVDGEGKLVHVSMSAPELSDIALIELLECDPRPTFILDLNQAQHPDDELLHTVFSNASLQRLPRIIHPAHLRRDVPVDYDESEQYSDFKEWATSSPMSGHTADGYPMAFSYQDLCWTYSTLRKRWRVISGCAIALKDTSADSFPSRPAESQKDNPGIGTASRDFHMQKEKGKAQSSIHSTWVDDLPTSEHVQLFKDTNWSATALGPLETWSDSLRQMTRLLMSDSRAASVFW